MLVDASAEDGKELRLASARLVVPEHAVVCDDFAAWLFGVETHAPADRFEIVPSFVVPHGRNRIASSRARTRQTVFPDADVVDLDGLRVTSPIRTASDLLRRRWRPYALAAADAMAHAKVIDVVELREFVAALRRFPGVRQAQELAPRVDARSESHGESWQRCRILDAGFPTPAVQHVVERGDGRIWRLDMAFVEHGVASEYDGREFHSEDDDVARDVARRSDLRKRFGWRFSIGNRENIFGTDPAFELRLGELLGMAPRARTW
ncbi:type IV toxin-antitoxin system AbiEi family antitoxin [Beutenbergia cavernae]|uniref:type IV toxin-antitoxin system AbiEi family antitoxin n=1 Tax=Beutenbergia cavernae TaxID=84757 RepID=UPI0002E31FBF|nr:type IV toxin-antitoxin system AbiEi family antitoxin [Beutenbergia cavernae]